MFRIPRTDFYLSANRRGYALGFMAKGQDWEPLWQFATPDALFAFLPAQLDLFMKSSREASPAMKAQKAILKAWLLDQRAHALSHFVLHRAALLDAITRRRPSLGTQMEIIPGTPFVLLPLDAKDGTRGYELYRVEDGKARFIWHCLHLETLLLDLPQLLTEIIDAPDLISQYERAVQSVCLYLREPATQSQPKVRQPKARSRAVKKTDEAVKAPEKPADPVKLPVRRPQSKSLPKPLEPVQVKPTAKSPTVKRKRFLPEQTLQLALFG